MIHTHCVPKINETGWTCERCGYRSNDVPKAPPMRRCQATPEQLIKVPPVATRRTCCPAPSEAYKRIMNQ